MSTIDVKKLHGSTNVEMFHCSYVWTIENFRFMSRMWNRRVNSTEFEMGEDGEFKWILHFYPFGLSDHHENNVSLFLQLIAPDDANHMVHFEFFIRTKHGERQQLSQFHVRNFKPYTSLGYSKLMTRRSLIRKNSEYLIDGSLIFECEIHLSTGNELNYTVSADLQQARMERKLLSDIAKLTARGTTCDAALLADGRRFPVHKAILMTRSPVFEAMFTHNTNENRRNEVAITDVEAPVLEHLIRFLYTGTVAEDIEEEVAKGLHAAADKYALEDLKEAAEKKILEHLRVDNAIDTLMIAHRHSSEGLKDTVVKFMKSNAFRIIERFSALVLDCEIDLDKQEKAKVKKRCILDEDLADQLM